MPNIFFSRDKQKVVSVEGVKITSNLVLYKNWLSFYLHFVLQILIRRNSLTLKVSYFSYFIIRLILYVYQEEKGDMEEIIIDNIKDTLIRIKDNEESFSLSFVSFVRSVKVDY